MKEQRSPQHVLTNTHRSWAWGYGAPPGPLIKPKRHEPHHLIGEFRENDLRRAARGWIFMAVGFASPFLIGLCAGLTTAIHPQWNAQVDALASIGSLVVSILAFAGYLLVLIDTQPPRRVAARILDT
jgi:hypothetical protein